MARVALHFPRSAKVVLYGVLLLSLSSGLTWWALEKWGTVEGEFGPEKSRWLGPVLKIHGASAFLVLIGFGYLLASHIHVGWRSRRSRVLGSALVLMIVTMIASGYGLYYIGDDDWREKISWLHRLSGLSLLPLLLGHVWAGHRGRKRPAAAA